MSKLPKYLRTVLVLLGLILVFGIGFMTRDLSAQQQIQDLLSNHEVQLQEIRTEKNKTVSNLNQALDQAGEERSALLDQIATLRARPPEIKYITKIKTVVEGRTEVLEVLPPEYEFKLKNGLPVASFQHDEQDYEFITADLTLYATVLVGENDSNVSIRARSSLDPSTQYELKVGDFEVIKIRDRKLFEPHILVGGDIHANATGPASGFHIATSLLHPSENWDLVRARVGLSSGALTFGVDPVGYNLGRPLPFFTNLWISGGPTLDSEGRWYGTINIGAKL